MVSPSEKSIVTSASIQADSISVAASAGRKRIEILFVQFVGITFAPIRP
jgi:hypothetical protein